MYIDGNRRGVTPFSASMSPKQIRVILLLDGYRHHVSTLDVRTDRATVLKAVLVKDPNDSYNSLE